MSSLIRSGVFFPFCCCCFFFFNFRTHEQDDYRSARFRMTFFLELKKKNKSYPVNVLLDPTNTTKEDQRLGSNACLLFND